VRDSERVRAASANTPTTSKRASVSARAAGASRESSSRQAVELESQRTASWVCRTTDGGSWSSCAGLEQRRRRVIDDRQPLVGGVAVSVAVELERSVTAEHDVGCGGLGGFEEFVGELRQRAVGYRVDEVDRDAERGG
jgi:hypothetical protein